MFDTSNGWAKTILPIGSSIKQAIDALNETSLRIVLITDLSRALVGTITDGDIRRGILNGLELTSEIDIVMQREPIVVSSGLTRESVLQLMTTNKIQQIPIVDENRSVIGLHLWDQLSTPAARPNTMVIMAGGKGTRLHPQTENCPKPLLPVAGKPIMEHIIDRAKVVGFSHFVIAIHHLGHMIEDYFGNGEAFGVKIEYLREKFPLGTAGALSLLDPLPKSSIVVTNGDVLTDIHYGELVDFHSEYKATATMAVRVHEWQNPYGVVERRGIEIVNYEEKPISRVHINAGVYVIEPHAINLLIKSTHCDMPTLFSLIQEQSMRVIAYPIHEPWLDIGHPKDLAEAQKKASNIGDLQGDD
jgi:dTDP-glucose pyrophosphorylase